MSTITINNKGYVGNSITIINGVVSIDGKVQDAGNEKQINITVTGDITNLSVDACISCQITGNAGSVKTVSGDVTCGDVSGSVSTVSGDVVAYIIHGSASTVSGDIMK